MSTDDGQDTPPLLRVVKGDPTPEELAALVAVVQAMANGAAAQAGREERPRPEWRNPQRAVRRPLHRGAGAWRASGLPG
jgi:hypothetical protein